MTYDHYDDLKFTEDYHYFLFYSEGPKGRLKKLVIYSKMKIMPGAYNLGLGTLKINAGGKEYFDGTEISDNGDRNKILATIAVTAYKFIDTYPDKKIYLTGFNRARTRLYQMAINHALQELSEKFILFGDVCEEDDVFDFQPFETGINYTGFLVQGK
jgi:hypothetical protein